MKDPLKAALVYLSVLTFIGSLIVGFYYNWSAALVIVLGVGCFFTAAGLEVK